MNDTIQSYQHIYIYKINDNYYINRCRNIFEIKPNIELYYLSKRIRVDILNRILSKINYSDNYKYDKNSIIYIKSIIDDYYYSNEIDILKEKINIMDKQIKSLTKIIEQLN